MTPTSKDRYNAIRWFYNMQTYQDYQAYQSRGACMTQEQLLERKEQERDIRTKYMLAVQRDDEQARLAHETKIRLDKLKAEEAKAKVEQAKATKDRLDKIRLLKATEERLAKIKPKPPVKPKPKPSSKPKATSPKPFVRSKKWDYGRY